jgi:dienelactone hydrolase
MSRCCLPLFALVLLVTSTRADDLDVLPAELPEGPRTQMLHRQLIAETNAALDRRAAEYEKIKTQADAEAYQQRMREFFLRQLGGFPERTPLDAFTTARIERDGYVVEKVIFASRPNFHVTGLLFLPPGNGPFPGVLVPCGHSAGGKDEEKYQRASIALAKQGFVSFCYDPLGQGERHQVLRADGTTAGPNHTVLGVSCIPLGTNFAQFRIWDGLRALDYLAGRPEVDPQRLGCTGNSGGGTLTSYLMALDERIVAAAPSCYLTTFRTLLPKNGPQDAEQNIFGQIAFGLTQAEYVMLRAPRPTLICTATKDMFNIHGSWELYRDAKRFYARFGFPERVDLVETDEGHGFHLQLREGAVRWMNRWLKQIDEPVFEPAFEVLAKPEALATEKGQVLHLKNERTVFDVNADTADRLAEQRRRAREANAGGDLLDEVRKLAGIRPLAEIPEPQATVVGSEKRDGYELRRIALALADGVTLPLLACVPTKRNGSAALYIDGAGKQAGFAELERLVRGGTLAVGVDPRGWGELHDPKAPQGPGMATTPEVKNFFLAYLLGKSLLGQRTEDVLATARWLQQYETDGAANSIRMIGVGMAGPVALHAAALEAKLFSQVELRQALNSWDAVVRDRAGCGPQLPNLVHGALQVYDLPDLRRQLGTKLTIVDPRDSQGRPISASE